MGEGKVVARTLPAGTPTWVRDATLNDSDKSFTVPADKIWNLIGIQAALKATATVGNRVMTANAANPAGDFIWTSGNTAAIAAAAHGGVTYYPSQTMSTTNIRGVDDGTGLTVTLNGSLPNPMILTAGCTIRVFDLAAIDPAADDMVVVLYYVELDV